jgi:hypothetical protein
MYSCPIHFYMLFCRLGDGSTLHVVELEECRDHHLVVEWQQDLPAIRRGNVQLVNCIGSHQDESTIEFSDALGYKGNVDRASGEFCLRVQGTFATCIPNESGLAGNVLLLLLLIPKGLGPEPDEVVVQVLQKAFCRPLHKDNYLSVITTC